MLAELIGNGRLKIVAAYYDLASGAVTMLEYAATAIGPGHRCPLAKTRGDAKRSEEGLSDSMPVYLLAEAASGQLLPNHDPAMFG